MSFPLSVAISSKTNIFVNGEHKTDPVITPKKTDTPKPLLIFSPHEAGEYPVIFLLHGFLLYNTFYSQLSHHIASHGFILVVPQLYTWAALSYMGDATREIEYVAEITNWLPEGLQKYLPFKVNADLTKLGLAGHSRGGKVAFGLALNRVLHTKINLKFSVLIGIDPVDGKNNGVQTLPKVLTYVPQSFNLEMPVMVIGSGLGEVTQLFMGACAPKGVNHKDFYNECREPACYFVVKDYGHLDMLDDDTEGIIGKFTYCMCKDGKAREPMRRFVGGAVVACLKAYLYGDFVYLKSLKDDENSPIVLQKVDYRF